MFSPEIDWLDELVHLERDEFNNGKSDGLKDGHSSSKSLVDVG